MYLKQYEPVRLARTCRLLGQQKINTGILVVRCGGDEHSSNACNLRTRACFKDIAYSNGGLSASLVTKLVTAPYRSCYIPV